MPMILDTHETGPRETHLLFRLVIDYVVRCNDVAAVDGALAAGGFGTAMTLLLDGAVRAAAATPGSVWHQWAREGKVSVSPSTENFFSGPGSVSGVSNSKVALLYKKMKNCLIDIRNRLKLNNRSEKKT